MVLFWSDGRVDVTSSPFDDEEDEEVEPVCDICDWPADCGVQDCHLHGGDWNGETGCHVTCEERQRKAT